MPERVLVTGATGKVGGELVRLLSGAGVEVKAATRRPAAARERLGGLAEVVELDYDLAATYDDALAWADRVFVVAPPFDPRASQHLESFVDWAVQAGVGHVVLVSAMGADGGDDDLAMRRVEKLVEATGVAWTFLRPNVYMQNFHPGFLGREIREEGTFHLPAGEARVSLVDARDVAEVAARVLRGDGHDGRAYTLTGPEALDHHEVARILGEAAGREVRYVPTGDDAMRERLLGLGWPRGQADVVVDFFHAIRRGDRDRVTGDVEGVLGRPPRSLEAFAREFAAAWKG